MPNKKGAYRRTWNGRRELQPKEVNKGQCPVCGAKHGETCFRLTEKSFRELSKTHRTMQREEARNAR